MILWHPFCNISVDEKSNHCSIWKSWHTRKLEYILHQCQFVTTSPWAIPWWNWAVLSFVAGLSRAHVPSYVICPLEHRAVVWECSRQDDTFTMIEHQTSDWSLVQNTDVNAAEHSQPTPGWSVNSPSDWILSSCQLHSTWSSQDEVKWKKKRNQPSFTVFLYTRSSCLVLFSQVP